MRIAFFEISAAEQAYFEQKFPEHALSFSSVPLTEENAVEAADCDIACVFIYSSLTRALLEKLPRLKAVATRSTGADHIDQETCAARGIAILTVPSYGENTVAEHTFALILALSRNVHKSYARCLKGDFSTDGLLGFDLEGKTLGVIGTGHIGLHTIRIAKGFGMHVLATDVRQERFLSEVLHFRYAELAEVLSISDIVTLHLPLLESTRHLIGREALAKMKPGSLLINTSRGGIVESEALLEALESGHLSGAGLDVLEGEEQLMEESQYLQAGSPHSVREHEVNRRLLALDNVVFTPHIAFYSREALRRILETTSQNIESSIRG